MRHQKKRHQLGRGASHRKATLAAMSTALIKHKRITTTVAKAKALRVFIEPILTRAKDATTHNHRQVFRKLQDKGAVKELFGEVADKIGDRQGGYTRIVRLGQRSGDGAEMAIIELVDYNDVKPEGGSKRRRRRTRRGGSSGGSRRGKGRAAAAVDAVKETAENVADKVEDAAEAVADRVDDAVDAAKDVAENVADKVEDAAEAVADKAEDLIDKVTGDDDKKKDDA